MRHGLSLVCGLGLLSLVGAVSADQTSAEASARAALALAGAPAGCRCGCEQGGPCDCDVCPVGGHTVPLNALATALAVAMQPPAPAKEEKKGFYQLPAGIYTGPWSPTTFPNSVYLYGGAFQEGQPIPMSSKSAGAVTVQPGEQAAYLARGWTFADGGTVNACAPGYAYTSGFYSSSDVSGCANGSCGTSTRRGVFHRRR